MGSWWGLGRPAAALATGGAAVLARGGMKIYTKAGDGGETGLFGGPRVPKDDARVEAYGAVDELGAVLGVARARGVDPELEALLAGVQDQLFTVGAELATPPGAKARSHLPP